MHRSVEAGAPVRSRPTLHVASETASRAADVTADANSTVKLVVGVTESFVLSSPQFLLYFQGFCVNRKVVRAKIVLHSLPSVVDSPNRLQRSKPFALDI